MAQPARFNGGQIVIIGGGVIGLSIAYHLAAAGHSQVVVLERGLLAEGTTAKATGGVRQQFSSPVNARMSLEAVRYFEHFAELVGEPFDFRQHGYLFVTRSAETLAAAASAVSMQQGLGIPSRMVGIEDIASLHPELRSSDLAGGTYCPTDGSGSPVDLAQAFARQARRRGVVVRQRTEVRGIEAGRDGAVRRVGTSEGPVEAEILIIAAGPWAGLVARMIDLEVPLRPTLRQVCAIARLPWMSPDLPFTVDLDSGAYLHVERSGGLIGGCDRDRPPGFDQTVDDSSLDRLLSAVTYRFPGLSDALMVRSWAGFREMTPDDHAMLGPVSGRPNIWLATGFSGHGFMHSPIVGRELSRWLLMGNPGIDLSPLDPMRFAAGVLARESLVF